MEKLWFWLVGFMLATYAVLDGFDFGAGILHLFIARTEEEREEVLQSVGPVWDGNEVWLLAAGGALVLAFPVLYATSFSGFYLPLIIVLWLLMGRALGIEMRLHYSLPDPLWKQFWDVIFAVSSFLLALFLGAALGNVIRGVPLNAEGTFFEPLWTDFRVGEHTGILDWFTILVGLAAVAAVTYHGALWQHWRTGQAVRQRVAQALPLLAGSLLVLWSLTIAASIAVQPLLQEQFQARPWLILFPLMSFAALGASWFCHRRQRAGAAFAASSLFVYAVMFSVVAGLYPQVLPARQPDLGLTAARAASAPETLRQALVWWIPGMLLVCAYTLFIYRTVYSTRSPLNGGRVGE